MASTDEIRPKRWFRFTDRRRRAWAASGADGDAPPAGHSSSTAGSTGPGVEGTANGKVSFSSPAQGSGASSSRSGAGTAQRDPSRRRRTPNARRFRTGRPHRYGLLARYSDWRHAGLDARARVPDPEGEGPVLTQTLVMLERLASDVAALEYRRYQEDTASHRSALARNRAQHEIALRARQAAETRLREVSEPLSEEELAKRRPGDEAISESLVRERRMREHRRRIEQAQKELDAAEARVAHLVQEAAILTTELRSRFDIARASVERIHEYVRRRRAAYWRRLVRRHPDGERINALLRIEPTAQDWPALPDWLHGDDKESQV